ncbi:hypothetical protein FRC08_004481 [Ceratobasidium sp. 394]|nr:hypothetical protein FRC08_004481 [Ceratobasidium sp. 394]
MQVGQQYSQWDQRNAAFVPPTRLMAGHVEPRDLSPPNTPGDMQPQHSPPVDSNMPPRPGAQNRQSTGFFSAFSRTKSAGSGQILSPPATPSANPPQPVQHQQPPPPPQDSRRNSIVPQPQSQTPSPRMQTSSPSGVTHSTTETPNPDAVIPGQAQSLMPPQQAPPTPQQQLSPQQESPFALGPTGIPLHPELRSVLRLNAAHQQKIYYSGRLSKRVERGTDGNRPAKDEGWIDIWCQLGGVTLSIWSMRAIEEANARGEQVPPQYINITDAFVQVLGSVTFPATATSPAKRFTNVLTLNTAGSNLLLFVCESAAALVSWAAALRLAAWEKSRLEEIYTAHLLRITLTESRVCE